jgi:hypothetical protein
MPLITALISCLTGMTGKTLFIRDQRVMTFGATFALTIGTLAQRRYFGVCSYTSFGQPGLLQLQPFLIDHQHGNRLLCEASIASFCSSALTAVSAEKEKNDQRRQPLIRIISRTVQNCMHKTFLPHVTTIGEKSISEDLKKGKEFFLDTLTTPCYYEVCTIVASWAF